MYTFLLHLHFKIIHDVRGRKQKHCAVYHPWENKNNVCAWHLLHKDKRLSSRMPIVYRLSLKAYSWIKTACIYIGTLFIICKTNSQSLFWILRLFNMCNICHVCNVQVIPKLHQCTQQHVTSSVTVTAWIMFHRVPGMWLLYAATCNVSHYNSSMNCVPLCESSAQLPWTCRKLHSAWNCL